MKNINFCNILRIFFLIFYFNPTTVVGIGCPSIGSGQVVPIGTTQILPNTPHLSVEDPSCNSNVCIDVTNTLDTAALGWSILTANYRTLSNNGGSVAMSVFSKGTDLKILNENTIKSAFEQVNNTLISMEKKIPPDILESFKAELNNFLSEQRNYYSQIAINASTNKDTFSYHVCAQGQGKDCVLGICNCRGRGWYEGESIVTVVCLGTATTDSLTTEVMKNVTSKFPQLLTPAKSVPAIEYRRVFPTGEEHYFHTATPTEIVEVDNNHEWSRTGYTFNVYPLDQAPSDTIAVARFYGGKRSNSVYGNPDSHFFTASFDERQFLINLFPKNCPQGWGHCDGGDAWYFEGEKYRVYLPTNSSCPEGTRPLYRLYNQAYTTAGNLNPIYPNRISNHRYTVDLGVVNFMKQQGWLYEGGKMCVPY